MLSTDCNGECSRNPPGAVFETVVPNITEFPWIVVVLPPTVIGPVLWVGRLTYPVIELVCIDLLPEELLEIILVEGVIILLPEELLEIILVEGVIVLLPVPIYLLPEELLETILVVGVVIPRFNTPSWVLSVPYEFVFIS